MTPAVRVTKRLLDVAGAATGIALTWPLALPIAVAIRLESRGPIIFRQRRCGALLDEGHGELRWTTFEIYKFRTMREDAEKGTGAVLASKGDPRVTRVGRFLRKTRLDELPQLWNVLKGDMSLVGPRPERPELLEALARAIPYFEERTRGVKPGLTGLAQVSLGYTGGVEPGSEAAKILEALGNPFGVEGAEGAVADDMRNKLLYDVAYAAALEDFWSYLEVELRVLAKTPLIMLLSKGH